MGFQGCSRVVSTCVLHLSTRDGESVIIHILVTDPLFDEKLQANCSFAPDFNKPQDFQSFCFGKQILPVLLLKVLFHFFFPLPIYLVLALKLK